MPSAKSTSPEPVTAAPGTPPTPADPPQAYEFTYPMATVYVQVPLTAHPAEPATPGSDGQPASGGRPATVFAWPDGPPDDRWRATSNAPNQLPDNEPAPAMEATK